MKRIETIEELKNSVLMETVIDRFRRATQPMKFVFFVRCKQLGGPVLIPAPPGRKVKSDLIRLLKKGNPVPYKGTMTRHDRKLHFRLDREPSSSVKRKLVQHLARVGSPVPSSDIVLTSRSRETSTPSDRGPSISASIEELRSTATTEQQNDIDELIQLRARAMEIKAGLRTLRVERESLLAIDDPTDEQTNRLAEINEQGPVLRENFQFHKALCRQKIAELNGNG